ncbi:MAG: carboxyltransferase domain-containing protein [Myxococcales bacterium]|nr:urea amidolyase family protein [Polyangiaceae bacterium]MDW8251952.1 carboxyltransferase domain-containing protein [Myxococcales bacterium]
MKALPFGERAFLLDLEIDHLPDRSVRTRTAARWLLASGQPDVAVGAGTLLLDPIFSWTHLLPACELVQRAVERRCLPELSRRRHVIPVVYDGPDLRELGARLRCDPQEIIRLHASPTYRVELLGFLPGFAYLGPVEGLLALPRREVPRPSVPAKSVGVAAGFTGIYPQASPGGWHLLGRAPTFHAFDPTTGAPSLLPGEEICFRPSREDDLTTPEETPAPRLFCSSRLRVVAAPACATVQDRGRPGKLHLGLPPSGPLDPSPWLAANLAVGNGWDGAAIEIPQGVLEVEAQGKVWYSVDGEAPKLLADGERLRIPGCERAVRYLAVAGGVAAPVLQGSRSVLPSARLGGRPLRRGDEIPVVGAAGFFTNYGNPIYSFRAHAPGIPVDLPVIPGPHLEYFEPQALDLLTREIFTVTRLGDRVGVRLAGPRIPVIGRLRLPVPMRRGAIEVTGDGTLIVLGPDHPVTGGYPVLATLTRSAQKTLARLLPGHPIRFRVV